MEKKNRVWLVSILLVCLAIAGGYYAYRVNRDDKDATVKLTAKFIERVRRYEQLGVFSEGRAAVRQNKMWGYINTKGRQVISCQYSVAYPFFDDVATVQKDGQWMFINRHGDEVTLLKVKAKSVGRLSEGLVFVHKDSNHFFILDDQGREICTGLCDFSWLADSNDWSCLPYYSQGKIYIPVAPDTFDCYDRQGRKTEAVSREEYDQLTRNPSPKPYIVFTHSFGEDYGSQYATVGLQDAVGKQLISAKYDSLNKLRTREKIEVSNGVVLVGLDLLDEASGAHSNSSIMHCYGYADLKGKDTFTKELKARCLQSRKRIMAKAKQQTLEMRERQKGGPSWLQGAWKLEILDDSGDHLGYLYEVFNHGTTKSYVDDRLVSERNYTVSGDMVRYESGRYQLDLDEHVVVSGDGRRMTKISSDVTYTPGLSSSQEIYIEEGSQSLRDESESRNDRTGRSSESFRFTTAYDVMGYLSGRTYQYNGSSLCLREDGCYLNGQCVSGAPVVVDYSTYRAIVRINLIPSGTIMWYINAQDGTMRNSLGELWE